MHGQAGGVTTDAGLSVDRWAQDALASVTHLPQVHRAGLALPEGGGRRLRFTANDRVNDGTVDWCHIDAYDDVPLNTAVRTGQPVLGGRSNRATLSRAGWRAPAGPAANWRSTVRVTVRTNRVVRRPSCHVGQ